jgi:nucleotide-binding universal stress UspA family protein
MSSVDQFASVFNAAAKTIFQYKPPVLKNALIITDLENEAAAKYVESAKSFFSEIEGPWDVLEKGDFTTVKDLLDIVGNKKPDLIVTYRHLHSEAWRWPHSLGEHLDVLIQVTEPPVAIMPHPDREGVPEHAMKNTANVMAINDHLTGEDCLVNHAAQMTLSEGTLHLTHIEDDVIFDRYMEVISKIPEIDTDVARETIRTQLLNEPSAYIDSVGEALSHELSNIKVIKHISHGLQLDEYRKAVDEHKADLVVVKAHDPDQQAMNATAYSIAVELRTTPLLIV